ncbi:4-hydroxythreonine-4-phosphate dehydrogenase [Polystyrenella longa]|uniref:4-hydroxythreonine-4-phosphate dehydrogenase n=1 Tax=Polystyrenella longa TaxID=2528007 RepID=A0A518CPR9_9PLAN|nr:4-hydroxythreonine-4-phosphate dehydrogenase PdxA [Polystyrenella longa]QDU81220.1 4-hydroxythreonine-4-phosphate dehydrogenase [Polystyrenella longa]
MTKTPLPRIGLTLGDVAGIGPEVTARAICDAQVRATCQPIVIGHPRILNEALELIRPHVASVPPVQEIHSLKEIDTNDSPIYCFNPAGDEVLAAPRNQFNAAAGKASYDYLLAAIRGAQAGTIDGITTAPLAKASLHLAGINYPGHTEILAKECGVDEFAMMLYLPPGEQVRGINGLAVSHVTLHTSIKSVPDLLSVDSIYGKIGLTYRFMQAQGVVDPRIAVCALNPHGGEEGLFGNEESELIAPAIERAREEFGTSVTGPFPTDTMMKRAIRDGEFDGVVAMYHDQGHIAIKLVAFDTAVNVTLGLPIVRTSPSHGTAYDIAWQGTARADGMITAIQVAANLAKIN